MDRQEKKFVSMVKGRKLKSLLRENLRSLKVNESKKEVRIFIKNKSALNLFNKKINLQAFLSATSNLFGQGFKSILKLDSGQVKHHNREMNVSRSVHY